MPVELSDVTCGSVADIANLKERNELWKYRGVDEQTLPLQ